MLKILQMLRLVAVKTDARQPSILASMGVNLGCERQSPLEMHDALVRAGFRPRLILKTATHDVELI